MEKQRLSRQAALVKQLDCGCGDASCADGKTCSHPVMRRPTLLKSVSEKRLSIGDGYGPGASGTPNVVVGQKVGHPNRKLIFYCLCYIFSTFMIALLALVGAAAARWQRTTTSSVFGHSSYATTDFAAGVGD